MKLAKCLQQINLTDMPDCEIQGIHNDSRKIKPGYLFIAYPGAIADGRLFIPQAIAAGAIAVVYEPNECPASFVPPSTLPCIAVPDLADKLALIATQFYANPSHSLSITGITGTSGKTTIAWQLAQAYDLLGEKAAYLGTLGQGPALSLQPLPNTTPDAICLQALLHDYKQKGLTHVFMEVSSHALSLNRVEGVSFNQAIYTNLSHEHLDFHKSMSAYAAAKATLFASLDLKSAIINKDDEYAETMIKALYPTCKMLTYGLHPTADVRAVAWECRMDGSQFEVHSPWGRHHVTINTLGLFNVYNSLAIFSTLVTNGIPVNNAIKVMQELQPVSGRMEVVKHEPCVIVDYAHKPDALEKVLSALTLLKKGRIIVVFGCGGDRDKAKRPMMGKIASKYADVVIITSDNSRSEDPLKIIDEIAQGLPDSCKVMKIVDREQAVQAALNVAERLDIILIAGKGHESYQDIGHQRFNFSDQEIVRKLTQ